MRDPRAQAVAILGSVFAAAAVLGLAWPGLGMVKGVLLWASMPVFVVLFWRYRGSQAPAAQQDAAADRATL